MKLGFLFVVGPLLPVGLVLLVGAFTLEGIADEAAHQSAASYAEAACRELNEELQDRMIIWKLYGRTRFVQEQLARANARSENLVDGTKYPLISKHAEHSASSSADLEEIRSVLGNELSKNLSEHTAATNRYYGRMVFGEVLITDHRGALVGATNEPSDYWQSDEQWWRQSAQNEFYVGDKSYDKSADMESIAVGLRIDDEAGEMAGVLKAILDVEAVDSLVQALPIARLAHGSHRMWLATADGSVLGGANVGAPPYADVCDRLERVEKAEAKGLKSIHWHGTSDDSEKVLSYARPANFGSLANPDWIFLFEGGHHPTAAAVTDLHYELKAVGLVSATIGACAMYLTWRHLRPQT